MVDECGIVNIPVLILGSETSGGPQLYGPILVRVPHSASGIKWIITPGRNFQLSTQLQDLTLNFFRYTKKRPPISLEYLTREPPRYVSECFPAAMVAYHFEPDKGPIRKQRFFYSITGIWVAGKAPTPITIEGDWDPQLVIDPRTG